jgi:hypothetical protein
MRIGAGDDVVAVQQHGGADADGNAGHGGDHGFLPQRQRLEKIKRLRITAAFGGFQKIVDIVTGAKRAGGAGKHDATDGVALIALAQRPGHVGIHRQRQRVFLLRAIHPDDADGAIIGHGDSAGHRPLLRRFLSRNITDCVRTRQNQ